MRHIAFNNHIQITMIAVMSGFFLLMCRLSFAGVSGSKHDMYFLKKGTDDNPCSYCHIPHNAAGDKIWSTWGNEARLTNGPSTKIGNMCYTCHDGTVTYRGGDVFSNAVQQHVMPSGSDCNMCHTVHDNTNGMFMSVPRNRGPKGSYCEACHGRTGEGNHQTCGLCHSPSNISAGYSDMATCYMCHAKAHGAVNYSAPGVRYPILKGDNTNGQFCESCHPEKAQAAAQGPKHPANYIGGAFGDITCETCHDPHRPAKQPDDNPYLLVNTNFNSEMCVNCHNGSQAPRVESHPSEISFGSIVPRDKTPATGTPPGNAIDDDANPPMPYLGSWADGMWKQPGADYHLNQPNLICETCHSIHEKGKGPASLRIDNTNNALCLNCHSI